MNRKLSLCRWRAIVLGLAVVLGNAAVGYGGAYHVWGGNTDFRASSDPSIYYKNIDKQGFAELGSSSGTATFPGAYAWYVIATSDRAAVDAVTGSDGMPYAVTSVLAYANVDYATNILNVADTNYARMGSTLVYDDLSATYGSYIVITNGGSWDSITVTVGELASVGGQVIYAGAQTGMVVVVATPRVPIDGYIDIQGYTVLDGSGAYTVSDLFPGDYYLVATMYTDGNVFGEQRTTDPWGAYMSWADPTLMTLDWGDSELSKSIALIDGTSALPNPFASGDTTPGVAQLLLPSLLTLESNPVFMWSAVPEATWYHLWIEKDNEYHWDQWIEGANTWAVWWDMQQYPGSYEWWVRTWNDYGYGEWSDSQTFSVLSSGPGTATVLSPAGTVSDGVNPVFTWTAVSDVSWYQVWIEKDGVYHWHEWVEGSTSWEAWWNIADYAGEYQCWVQTWNEYGYGEWSVPTSFEVEVGGERVELLSPAVMTVSDSPWFRWSSDTSATWYQVWIHKDGEYFWNEWTTGSSSWVPWWNMTDYVGSYEWWVQTWSETDGYGGWSDGQAFDIYDMVAMTNLVNSNLLTSVNIERSETLVESSVSGFSVSMSGSLDMGGTVTNSSHSIGSGVVVMALPETATGVGITVKVVDPSTGVEIDVISAENAVDINDTLFSGLGNSKHYEGFGFLYGNYASSLISSASVGASVPDWADTGSNRCVGVYWVMGDLNLLTSYGLEPAEVRVGVEASGITDVGSMKAYIYFDSWSVSVDSETEQQQQNGTGYNLDFYVAPDTRPSRPSGD